MRCTYENLRIEYKIYIKRNDFDTFKKLEDLGKEWEIELKKSEIKGKLLQITEPKRENNENQNFQNRKQQNIPAVPSKLQNYNRSQYRKSYSRGSQPRIRNNQDGFQYNPYNQLIPRMNHLALNRVPSQTQPTIEFPAENRENPAGNTQQNSQT